MFTSRLRLAATGLLLYAWQSAVAVPIAVYDDRADFISDSGAVDIGSVPAAPFSLAGSINTSRNWSTLIPGSPDVAINGVENFDFISPGPLYSFGFDFHEPNVPSPVSPDTCNDTCFDSTFEVTLVRAGLAINSFSFNRPDASLEFVGVISRQAFDRVRIREIIGGIDNEFFGNFLVGREPVNVPEPGTLLLLSAGLLGMYRVARQPLRVRP